MWNYLGLVVNLNLPKTRVLPIKERPNNFEEILFNIAYSIHDQMSKFELSIDSISYRQLILEYFKWS